MICVVHKFFVAYGFISKSKLIWHEHKHNLLRVIPNIKKNRRKYSVSSVTSVHEKTGMVHTVPNNHSKIVSIFRNLKILRIFYKRVKVNLFSMKAT